MPPWSLVSPMPSGTYLHGLLVPRCMHGLLVPRCMHGLYGCLLYSLLCLPTVFYVSLVSYTYHVLVLCLPKVYYVCLVYMCLYLVFSKCLVSHGFLVFCLPGLLYICDQICQNWPSLHQVTRHTFHHQSIATPMN